LLRGLPAKTVTGQTESRPIPKSPLPTDNLKDAWESSMAKTNFLNTH
jgi:hypothetical protein